MLAVATTAISTGDRVAAAEDDGDLPIVAGVFENDVYAER